MNHAKEFGRWEFAELTEVYEIGSGLAARVEAAVTRMIDEVAMRPVARAKG